MGSKGLKEKEKKRGEGVFDEKEEFTRWTSGARTVKGDVDKVATDRKKAAEKSDKDVNREDGKRGLEIRSKITDKDSGQEKRVTLGDGLNDRNRGGGNLNQKEFLQLLKSLRIELPKGVLTEELIERANTERNKHAAQVLLQDLEDLLIRFKAVPRLTCRVVKHCLALKRDSQVLQITRQLFFETVKENDKDNYRKQWEENKSNTGNGLKLRDRYRDATTIFTPSLFFTAVTRRSKTLEVETVVPIVTEGTIMRVADIDKTDYSEESSTVKKEETPGQEKFGMFFQNKHNELEMLKFFHELEGVKQTVTYSKGNKVECGFLSGRLDFLAQIHKKNSGKTSKSGIKERLVIECKSTTGDMEGKLFTKVPKSVHAKINQNHEYSYQVQTYMYIINSEAKLKKIPQMKRAVMVVRHYHQEGGPAKDLHWNYLKIDPSVQAEIQELTVLCQGDVLAQYLALLNLIFEKETDAPN